MNIFDVRLLIIAKIIVTFFGKITENTWDKMKFI